VRVETNFVVNVPIGCRRYDVSRKHVHVRIFIPSFVERKRAPGRTIFHMGFPKLYSILMQYFQFTGGGVRFCNQPIKDPILSQCNLKRDYCKKKNNISLAQNSGIGRKQARPHRAYVFSIALLWTGNKSVHTAVTGISFPVNDGSPSTICKCTNALWKLSLL
jgi:hypothetical protein